MLYFTGTDWKYCRWIYKWLQKQREVSLFFIDLDILDYLIILITSPRWSNRWFLLRVEVDSSRSKLYSDGLWCFCVVGWERSSLYLSHQIAVYVSGASGYRGFWLIWSHFKALATVSNRIIQARKFSSVLPGKTAGLISAAMDMTWVVFLDELPGIDDRLSFLSPFRSHDVVGCVLSWPPQSSKGFRKSLPPWWAPVAEYLRFWHQMICIPNTWPVL